MKHFMTVIIDSCLRSYFASIYTNKKKNNFCSRRARNVYISWSGIVFYTRCFLQILPIPHSFSVIICWNFENCTFSPYHFLLHWKKIQKYVEILTYFEADLCPKHDDAFCFSGDHRVFRNYMLKLRKLHISFSFV